MDEARGYVRKRKEGRRTVYFARIKYRDQLGEKREKERKCSTHAAAKDEVKNLLRELEMTGNRSAAHDRKTVADLVDFYIEHFAHEPKKREGLRISGLASYRSVQSRLKAIREVLGKRPVREMTFANLRAYRDLRLEEPLRLDDKGKPTKYRSVTAVNREMEILRRLLNIAVREGWIARNPFDSSSRQLILHAHEKKRQRVLSKAEEEMLLAACELHPYRSHLRPIVICALDTGMRKGEILSLKWSDVDFDAGLILIRAETAKTEEERVVGLTDRLQQELEELKLSADTEEVFSVSDVKRSFDGAKSDAGLLNLRFHDLRHTCGTRLVQRGMPLAEVARILGHRRIETTFRYANATEETPGRAARLLGMNGEQAGREAGVN